ncbi:MAG TPA: tetratricopeptide repeat protein, partial [Acidobacteriota bacterium]|nr:tetratricopeptide repeat protein [Acidobacteriota bacterium]
YEESEKHFQTALQLDPANFEACYHYARLLWQLGKLEQTLAVFKRANEIRPEDYRVPALATSVCIALKKSEELKEFYRKTVKAVQDRIALNPDDSRAYYLGAAALAGMGNREKAVEWAERALAFAPDDPGHLYNVATTYAVLGENDQALSNLEKAIQNGWASRSWIENDGDWTNLRNDPRFQALLQKIPAD